LITGRRHQVRTLPAETYLFLLERLPGVADIREGVPILDLDETLRLCGALDIEHEYDDNDPEPFIIDFVLTRRVGDDLVHFARSLQATPEPASGRQLERFRVIHAWCAKQGVDWRPVDTSQLTEPVNRTLHTLRSWHRHRYVPERQVVEAFAKRFAHMYKRGATLGELIADISAKSGENMDRCMNHFYYVGWAGYVNVDLRHPLTKNKPVVLNGSPRP
jgi:hypothetical protein